MCGTKTKNECRVTKPCFCFTDLVHTPEMLSFVNTSGKPAKPEDELIMDKYMSHNLFGTGQIILRPGAEKGKQHVRADTMV